MEYCATRNSRAARGAAEECPFDLVLMLGDNNYGDGSPESYRVRFEEPYKPLLDAGVKFYAARGNHDAGAQWDISALQHGRASGITPSSAKPACCRRCAAIACSSSRSTR